MGWCQSAPFFVCLFVFFFSLPLRFVISPLSWSNIKGWCALSKLVCQHSLKREIANWFCQKGTWKCASEGGAQNTSERSTGVRQPRQVLARFPYSERERDAAGADVNSLPTGPARKSLFSLHDTRPPPPASFRSPEKKYNVTFDLRRGQRRRRRKWTKIFGEK